MDSRASIIIPAHNEEKRIRGLLETLMPEALSGRYAVFVVCNGCSDRTRDVALEYAGVNVIDIEQMGKHFALNRGDDAAGSIFPRFYCDADLHIDVRSIDEMIDVLNADAVLAVGPCVVYETEGRSWGMQQYVKALASPHLVRWSDAHLVGRGIYGTSRRGRARFERFPSLIADDRFFDGLFGQSEKVVVQTAMVKIWTTKDLADLIRAEARVVRGNQELHEFHESSAGSDFVSHEFVDYRLSEHPVMALRQWMLDLRPQDLVPLAVFMFVKLSSRLYLSMFSWRRRTVRWR